MLSIGGQYEPRRKIGYAGWSGGRLTLFVADQDGERVFEADGGVSLEGIEIAGDVFRGSLFSRCEAFKRCEAFIYGTGATAYNVEQTALEAIQACEVDDLESMLRS